MEEGQNRNVNGCPKGLPHHAGAGPTECKRKLTVSAKILHKSLLENVDYVKRAAGGTITNYVLASFWSNICWDGWGPPATRKCFSWCVLKLGFVCFRVLYCLVDLALSHTSPLGFRGGWGCRGLTSGFCVSPPAPGAAMPPSPPGTSLKCPHLQTPVSQNKERLTLAGLTVTSLTIKIGFFLLLMTYRSMSSIIAHHVHVLDLRNC